MNRLEAALIEVAGHFEEQRIPYMVIGGFANLHWGRPRLTQDLDLKVDVEESDWPALIRGLSSRFKILVPDPAGFLLETRVLPIETATRVRADLIVGELPYEKDAIHRAVTLPIAGRGIRVCTAEDLILHKIISDRARDRDDVEGVIQTRGRSLDREYLDPRVREMAAGLERPDMVSFYEACLRKVDEGP